MKVFINFIPVKGPYGGANSFLSALVKELQKYKITFTNNINDKYDIAFLNALTEYKKNQQITKSFVRSLSNKNIPIIHRKVGYSVSGSKEMREIVEGVVHGNRIQIEFSEYLTHSVFQSNYSKEIFFKSGFKGNYDVISNGANNEIFNFKRKKLFWGRVFESENERSFWDSNSPLKLIISSWSRDYNKGFNEYKKIDDLISGSKNITVSFVGRKPDDIEFQNIKIIKPVNQKKLACHLSQHHVYLTLSKDETCSNSLIEAMNCGLPVIYLDSGANKEIASDYGVEYKGNILNSIDEIKSDYPKFIEKLRSNPYKIKNIAKRYLDLLNNVL